MGGRGDPGRSYDADAVVAGGGSARLAGMDAHPHAYNGVAGPSLRRKCTLSLGRRLDRIASVRECEEERVALVVDLLATVTRDRVA